MKNTNLAGKTAYEKSLIAKKDEKKKSANRAGWLLWLFILIFIAIIIRFAVRIEPGKSLNKSMPSGDDAFEIAKEFVKPTLGSANVEFGDGEYQFSKNVDSVYIVKSYYETKTEGNEKIKTAFVITLKFNGGPFLNKQNWAVQDLNQK